MTDLEPSPAELGDTMTVQPGEWTPLDDHGTEIYLYGDQPADVAVQFADRKAESIVAAVRELAENWDEQDDENGGPDAADFLVRLRPLLGLPNPE
jgi:hypothetical protein